MEPLVTAAGLYHYFGDFCAVRDLSLELSRGEVLGLLGPNGAGKSTTLRILSGVLAPTRGRLRLNGVDPCRDPVAARADLGYLPERPPLHPDLTVDEYLAFCARLRKVTPERLTSAVRRVKQRCGLEQSGRRLIGNLSKGFRQRVGIAQAIVHEPALVILDEPSSGLDPNQIREVRALIRGLGREHGVLLSTHILTEVQAVCDRVLILHRGRVVFSERLDDLRRRDTGDLTIRLGNPPATEAVSGMPGVALAERTGEGRFRLRLRDQADVSVIAERVVANGWRLLELVPEIRALEQVFTRLTTTEPEA